MWPVLPPTIYSRKVNEPQQMPIEAAEEGGTYLPSKATGCPKCCIWVAGLIFHHRYYLSVLESLRSVGKTSMRLSN
jgi:hypothetical protein